MDFGFVLAGLVLLILGGNWLLKASVGFSLRLQIPKIVIGMTIVSFATSAPELIVSVNAALDGHADIALGNVVGSNIANLGLVLGITVLLSTIYVEKSFYKIDWPVMMIATLMLYGFIAFDGLLQQYEGIILFSFLIIFLIYLLRYQTVAVVDEMPEDDEELPLYKNLIYMVIGGVALWSGSELIIDGAIGIAKQFEISERIIGITIVSVGTSIPELAASVIAILNKEKAISIGNLIGSNVFNILAVLGITSMITPITVQDYTLITSDIYWMLAISLMVFPLVFVPKRMQLGWREGIILLGFYITFMIVTFS